MIHGDAYCLLSATHDLSPYFFLPEKPVWLVGQFPYPVHGKVSATVLYLTGEGIIVSPQLDHIWTRRKMNVYNELISHITTTNHMQLYNPWRDILSPP